MALCVPYSFLLVYSCHSLLWTVVLGVHAPNGMGVYFALLLCDFYLIFFRRTPGTTLAAPFQRAPF